MITQWNGDAIYAKAFKASTAGMTRVGVILEKGLKDIIGRNHGGIPSMPGQPPNSQTNNLRGQIRYEQRDPLTIRAGSGAFYGEVLEFGKTIRAKKKMLLFPISKEMKRRCARGERPKNIIMFLRFNKRRPLQYIKTRKGVMIARPLAEVKRSSTSQKWGGPSSVGEGLEMLFFMTPSVTIAPRPWMRPTLAKLGPTLPREFSKEANRVWRAA